MNSAQPKLLPVAGLVSLLALGLGAVALFSLSFTNEKSVAALERLDRLHRAELAAVVARVSFKTQVQEWKNILLRGRDASDFAAYRQRFDHSAAEVQSGLADLQQQLGELGLESAVAGRLRDEHRALGEAYEKALADYRTNDSSTAFTVDAAVRGIDRKLNDDIDALSRTVEQAAVAELSAFGEAAAARYATLRKITLGVAAAAVLAAFWLVFQATRTR